MYAPASLPPTTVGKMVLPVNAAEESTMSRSMNSIDCGDMDEVCEAMLAKLGE